MPDLAAPAENSDQSELDAFLAKAGAKDRTQIQRHLAAIDAESDSSHGTLWRRIAGTLAALAPMPLQTAGHGGVLFFIPDGKYRMQVFAMEDAEGRLSIYLPDILAEAVRKKILRATDNPAEFAIVGAMRHTLRVELLDAQNTPEPPAHVKNMLGWNRKAMRVTLPVIASEGPRVEAAEALFALAAKQWAAKLARPAPAAVVASAAAPPPPISRAAPAPRGRRPEGPKKRTA